MAYKAHAVKQHSIPSGGCLQHPLPTSLIAPKCVPKYVTYLNYYFDGAVWFIRAG